MYVAMMLVKRIETNMGTPIRFHGMDGCQGMLPVFQTPEQAREIYGPDVAVLKVDLSESNDDRR